jgi:GNAT superfamily N-acetyltransferase
MTTKISPQINIADATLADFDKIAPRFCPGSLLRDYFRVAGPSSLRCLALHRDDEIIGFGLLVFRRPEFWPGAGDSTRLPEIVGLGIRSSEQGRGYGSAFMRAIEAEAVKAGYRELYLASDPINNPHAFGFFQHLNYHALQTEPFLAAWQFYDSQGALHRGEDWLVNMVKYL